MMLIDNTFELGIPTHIKFTLFKYDYFDSIIISRVKKECKNLNLSKDGNEYTVKVSSFLNAIKTSKRLRTEIEKAENSGFLPNPALKPNSVYFIVSILSKLENLEFLTFSVNDDKKYTRLVKGESGHVLSFYFSILEGIFDLTQLLDRKELDIFNKTLIEYRIMDNKYLDRKPYFYMKASALLDILTSMEVDGKLDAYGIIDQIDPKLEEDDPTLVVKTDYTPY
jgi:hypothetical protein